MNHASPDSGIPPRFNQLGRRSREWGEHVETAVWAWVNFGGLDARTRRGCGALFCKELAPKNASDLERWFKDASFQPTGDARDWPTLPGSVFVGTQAGKSIDVWKSVVGLLQSFRQGEGIGGIRTSNTTVLVGRAIRSLRQSGA